MLQEEQRLLDLLHLTASLAWLQTPDTMPRGDGSSSATPDEQGELGVVDVFASTEVDEILTEATALQERVARNG